MGAHMSSTSVADSGGPALGDIPESCIAAVLGHLDPPEICRLARLNRAFRGASSADFIWESKLPPNYTFLIHKLFSLNHDHDRDHDERDHGGQDVDDLDKREEINANFVLPPAFVGFTKMDIFARLSQPTLFDDGTKEIWVDKKTGGVCLSMSSKALSIAGIHDRRYWNRIPNDQSRFKSVAYLIQTWWLEVSGSLEFRFPAGTYTLFFKLQLGRSSMRFGRKICNLDHIHGWKVKPVQFQLTTSNGQHFVSRRHLDNPGSWILYHAGDFVVENQSKLTKIKFSLTQIDCTHTKGGLSIDSVLIYPKEVALHNCL